ncbi:hypothetical protein [Aeribacillus sp. FSL M8-0254]|uniref:hypothetical protein n=1 Tax=Aeribacillus sp. FSL M8-0254 TaxID=2954577 RepID=UPI0030F555A6
MKKTLSCKKAQTINKPAFRLCRKDRFAFLNYFAHVHTLKAKTSIHFHICEIHPLHALLHFCISQSVLCASLSINRAPFSQLSFSGCGAELCKLFKL